MLTTDTNAILYYTTSMAKKQSFLWVTNKRARIRREGAFVFSGGWPFYIKYMYIINRKEGIRIEPE
jgi:hypothetical protein